MKLLMALLIASISASYGQCGQFIIINASPNEYDFYMTHLWGQYDYWHSCARITTHVPAIHMDGFTVARTPFRGARSQQLKPNNCPVADFGLVTKTGDVSLANRDDLERMAVMNQTGNCQDGQWTVQIDSKGNITIY